MINYKLIPTKEEAEGDRKDEKKKFGWGWDTSQFLQKQNRMLEREEIFQEEEEGECPGGVRVSQGHKFVELPRK